MAEFNEGQFEGIEDYRDLAGVALSLNAMIAEMYLEMGHADPLLFKLIEKTAEVSQLMKIQEFTDRLELLKMRVGQQVDEIIEEVGHDIEKGSWS